MFIWIWNSSKAGIKATTKNNLTAISVGCSAEKTIALPLFCDLPDPLWDLEVQTYRLDIEKQKSIRLKEYYDAVIESKKLLTVEI